jgi:hypothetical protein
MEDDSGFGYRAPDEARYDQLISDSRQELFDEWGDMNEHMGIPSYNPPPQ